MTAMQTMGILSAGEFKGWVCGKSGRRRARLGRILTRKRLIGSIGRERLDHLIVFNEVSLRRNLKSYFDYYQRSRKHLSLGKDAPEGSPIQPVELGAVAGIPEVGGLHHRYERRAA